MADLCAETNAVLKLELGEQGGTRRIALKKLWDESTSSISYQRLVDMALKYKEITGDAPLNEYHVTVTYDDEDGDCITISTDDELAEAFEQFASKDPPILRAKASVKRVGGKKKDDKNYLNTLRQAVSDIDQTAKKNKRPATATTDEKSGPSGTKPVEQMQHALESFVMILGQAVDTLSKNVEMVQKKKKENRENRRAAKNGPSRSVHVSGAFNPRGRRCPVFENMDVAHIHVSPPCEGFRKSATTEDPSESEKKDIAKKLMKEAVDAVNAKKKEESVKDKKEPVKEEKKSEKSNILPVPPCFDREFIHGRHTCDSCLVTPIVGIRYHALNIPDHDLCDKCIGNYKGHDMVLEPTQLERDRYMQNRWKRRQFRLERKQTQTRVGTSDAPQKNTKSLDIELDMAIRRSLLDMEKQKEQSKETETEKSVEKESVETQTEVPQPVQEETVVPQETSHEKEEEKSEDSAVEENEEKAEIPSPSDESIENKQDESIDANQGEETVATEPVVEDKKAVEEVVEIPVVEDVVEEQTVVEDEEVVDEEKGEIEEESTERDISFSEDAQGQGDVAIAIGNALDEYANAIDAVVTEVQKNEDCLEGVESVDSDIELGCTIVESANDNDSEEGSVIVDGNSAASSKDSWQFLDEDGGEVTSDEMIAQAAQILGSALFESGIDEKESSSSSSQMEDSALTDPSAFNKSSVSSVPTCIDSIFTKNEISPLVLSRWASELKELHEMGFLDDHRSIEALEHLEAANIGVDSEETVTVAQAVNFLLANHK